MTSVHERQSVFLLDSINCLTEEFMRCLSRYQEYLRILHYLPNQDFEKTLAVADAQCTIELEQTIYDERITIYKEALQHLMMPL